MYSKIVKEERPPALVLLQARPGMHHEGFIWKVKGDRTTVPMDLVLMA